ncbi:hypothetical protein [Mesorhizobium sp. L-8-3]|uniref:hypothetical protein n=1 Tax=Mesorhizobium sp. L-8-3 TaxID=2744522 RepID=UPI001928C87B|nr:hypothetical protein [Mesorhizobium sp. L-8-3]BCH26027.1 hypothetical protein MesoLjLb_58120 [Mesorhizobium sp. L-8-3]
MSSSDFRQIANRAEHGKAERLFRAAVSAFCALPRPSRREIAQLEDLALPLFDSVSAESKRYVAAALSEIPHAPPALVRRLSNEPVGIAAPLLIRSDVLSDTDLIILIGRHGLPHARAIGRRRNLNPTIANLVRALDRPAQVPQDSHAISASEDRPPSPPVGLPADTPAESVRQKLRGMMLPATADADDGRMSATAIRNARFSKLRATALTGHLNYFQVALAEVLGIDLRHAKAITETANYADLSLALRVVDLEVEQAFLIVAAIFPGFFGHAEGIRLFVDRYRLSHRETAREKLRGWKAETVAERLARRPDARHRSGSNANEPAHPPSPGALRAS